MLIPMNIYNLNEVQNGARPECNNLTIGQTDGTAIPKTPEIVNLLAAISPLEEYMKNSHRNTEKTSNPDWDTGSSSSTVDSPTSPHRPTNIKSQFIKAGLKLSIQKKRQTNNTLLNEADQNSLSHDSFGKYDESSLDTEEDDGNSSHSEANSSKSGLTPEDEDRRKRRRERNKIAATKCRQKKRERQDHLLQESTHLENQNQELKNKIEDLRNEYERLRNMYTGHKVNCVKPSPEPSPVEDLLQPPSFTVNNNCVSNLGFTGYGNADGPLPSDLQANAYDFTSDPFVRNPSVMLSESDNTCKNTYLRQNGTSEDSSYKIMPSFNLIDESGNHFDMTYVQ